MFNKKLYAKLISMCLCLSMAPFSVLCHAQDNGGSDAQGAYEQQAAFESSAEISDTEEFINNEKQDSDNETIILAANASGNADIKNEVYKSLDFSDVSDVTLDGGASIGKVAEESHRSVLELPEGSGASLLSDFASVSVWDGETAETDWYDDDTPEFTLTRASQLAGLAILVNRGITFSGKTVRLGADMDFDGKEWTPIGYGHMTNWKPDSANVSFCGAFDGGWHTIKNVYISKENSASLGFFGSTSNASIKNLIFKDFKAAVRFTTNKQKRSQIIGGLTGIAERTAIENCAIIDFEHINVSSKANNFLGYGEGSAGGFSGFMYGGTLKNSYVINARFECSNDAYKAPLYGRVSNTTTTNCYIGGEIHLIDGRGENDQLPYGMSGNDGCKYNGVYSTTKLTEGKNLEGTIYTIVDEDTLKNSLVGNGLKAPFVNDTEGINGGYPHTDFYRSLGKKNIYAEFLPEEGSEFRLIAKDKNGAESAFVTMGSAEVNPGEWNTLSLRLDFGAKSINYSINGGSWHTAELSGGEYSSLKIESVRGKTLFDNMTLGNDYYDELIYAKNETDAYLEAANPEKFEGFELPTEINGRSVTWKSSDTDAVSDDGMTVTKQSWPQDVTLTAEIILNSYDIIRNASVSIEYNVVVPPVDGLSDKEKAEAIVNKYLTDKKLSDEKHDYITKDLNALPTKVGDCTIEWASTNEDYVSNDGKVTLPYEDNENLTMIATVKCGGETAVKEFPLTVISVDNLLDAAKSALDYKDLTSETNTQIKSDLILPKSGLYDTKIEWASSNTSLIDSDGFVTRSDSNETVTVTAIFTLLGCSTEKDFYFNVMLSDAVMLDADVSAFAFNKTEAAESFTLPVLCPLYKTVIKWSSDSSVINIIGADATVTRPSYNGSDAIVTLTARFVQGTEETSRTYLVRVPRMKTDEELVDDCLAFITWNEINICPDTDVRENFSLPLVYDEGVRCTWASSDEATVTNEGIVIRPDVGEENKTCSLTVTAVKNSVSKTKKFDFTVSAFDEPDQVLEKASAELNFGVLSSEPINLVTKNLNLMKEWRYGTTVEWTSSNESVISPDGTVTLPAFGSGESEVTLTAKIIYGTAGITKKFSVGVAEEGGKVSALYRDFEADEYGAVKGSEFEYYEPYQYFTVADNPNPSEKNNSTKVAMYKREGGDNGASRYELFLYPTEERGSFDLSFDLYVESMPQYGMLFRTYSNQAFADSIMPNGSVLLRDLNWSTSTKNNMITPGKWYNIKISYDTIKEVQNLYVDGVSVFGEKQFISLADSTGRAYKLAFRFDGSDLEKDHVVYLDNISIERTVNYSEFLTAAYEQFERKFIASQNISAVSGDLIIPNVSVFETDITCKSSNPDIVSDDGKVTLPDKDTEVTFTVTFSNRWGGKKTRVFNLLVKKDGSAEPIDPDTEDARSVIADKAYAEKYLKENNIINGITTDVKLPYEGENGSKITWTSSDADVISNTGSVTRQKIDTDVKLTGIISKGSISERLVITLTVKAKARVNEEKGSGGGKSSGISGIGGGSLPENNVKTDENKNTDPEEKPLYNDISESHWAYNAVRDLTEKKIISGDDNGNFLPENEIKREEFTKLIVALAGFDTSASKDAFTDVDPQSWYAPFVNTAFKEGIIKGMADGSFGVGMPITREDMCVIIYNLLKKNGDIAEATGVKFADEDDISDYAKEAISALGGIGAVNGKDNNMFAPKAHATRAEAAQIIYNIVHLNG